MRGLDHVELETLDWVAWFNTTRLLEPIGWLSPTEYEQRHYREAAQTMTV